MSEESKDLSCACMCALKIGFSSATENIANIIIINNWNEKFSTLSNIQLSSPHYNIMSTSRSNFVYGVFVVSKSFPAENINMVSQ